MIRKVLKILSIIIVVLLSVIFYLSPRLGGILNYGKDAIDTSISILKFDTITNKVHTLLYQDISDRLDLIQLRKEFNLDSIVSGAVSDFEKVVAIQSWVQGRWKHNGDNVPENNDAAFILRAAAKGQQFRCVEYSIVASQCLSSLGFIIRGLGLMTKDIEDVKWGGGHVVNEVYLKDLKKWIMIDPQYDVIAARNGIPMNAVELQYCIAHQISYDIINPNQTITKEAYESWIAPYLYYFNTSLKGERIEIWDRIIGNKKQLTLYPIGAEIPRYFQKLMRINNSYYTHSVKDFYPVITL